MRNLLRGGRRNGFLFLALVLATACLALTSHAFDGVAHYTTVVGKAVHSGDFNVAGLYRTATGQVVDVIREPERVEELLRPSLPTLDYIAPRTFISAKLLANEKSLPIVMLGVDVKKERRLLDVLGGPEANEREALRQALSGPTDLVLFASQAARMNVVVGEPVTVLGLARGKINNTLEMKVTRILEDTGEATAGVVLCSRQATEKLFLLPPGSATFLAVYLEGDGDGAPMVEALAAGLRQQGFDVPSYTATSWHDLGPQFRNQDWRGQRLMLSRFADELAVLSWRQRIMTGISATLYALMAMVIATGMMNSMFVAVRQRTNEVGMLRALGASSFDVLLMFLVEGAVLGAVASLAGALLGAAASELLDAAAIRIDYPAFREMYFSTVLHFTVRIRSIISLTAIFSVTSALACVLPAVQASRLTPVSALRKGG